MRSGNGEKIETIVSRIQDCIENIQIPSEKSNQSLLKIINLLENPQGTQSAPFMIDNLSKHYALQTQIASDPKHTFNSVDEVYTILNEARNNHRNRINKPHISIHSDAIRISNAFNAFENANNTRINRINKPDIPPTASTTTTARKVDRQSLDKFKEPFQRENYLIDKMTLARDLIKELNTSGGVTGDLREIIKTSDPETKDQIRQQLKSSLSNIYNTININIGDVHQENKRSDEVITGETMQKAITRVRTSSTSALQATSRVSTRNTRQQPLLNNPLGNRKISRT